MLKCQNYWPMLNIIKKTTKHLCFTNSNTFLTESKLNAESVFDTIASARPVIRKRPVDRDTPTRPSGRILIFQNERPRRNYVSAAVTSPLRTVLVIHGQRDFAQRQDGADRKNKRGCEIDLA